MGGWLVLRLVGLTYLRHPLALLQARPSEEKIWFLRSLFGIQYGSNLGIACLWNKLFLMQWGFLLRNMFWAASHWGLDGTLRCCSRAVTCVLKSQVLLETLGGVWWQSSKPKKNVQAKIPMNKAQEPQNREPKPTWKTNQKQWPLSPYRPIHFPKPHEP